MTPNIINCQIKYTFFVLKFFARTIKDDENIEEIYIHN